MLLIGSKALEYHDIPTGRPIKDLDYISTIEDYHAFLNAYEAGIKIAKPLSSNSMYVEFKNGSRREFSIAWPGSSNEECLNYARNVESNPFVPSIDFLLMIKLSHRYKKNSPHFLKTMQDIRLLRKHGANLNKDLSQLLRNRERETYNYPHPSLMQDKSGFFHDQGSLYVYEHDDIHKAVAVDDTPAYTKFSKDGEEVMVDRSKWDKLPDRIRNLAGLEESYVLAIERSLVPFVGVLTRKQAFLKALEKVCTSITSGWFREWCWEHYDEIVAMYDESYYDKFLIALHAGKIGQYKGTQNVYK